MFSCAPHNKNSQNLQLPSVSLLLFIYFMARKVWCWFDEVAAVVLVHVLEDRTDKWPHEQGAVQWEWLHNKPWAGRLRCDMEL